MENDKEILGVNFRFMFYEDERIGIIKVLPSVAHDGVTQLLKDEIHDSALAMGVSKLEMFWVMSSSYRVGTTEHSQADDESSTSIITAAATTTTAYNTTGSSSSAAILCADNRDYTNFRDWSTAGASI
ncbi:hypothetical protein VTN00DRAFT_3222 [Thermoascus crustaceus]|uniref:uncharacterized protein n=1 Tax=Thermoascus crustaceus TaxID=5088 RepID=UPI003743561F